MTLQPRSGGWRAAIVGLLWLLLNCPASALATSYYLSDCQAGAAPACMPGDDNNAGTSPATAWRSIDKLNTRVEELKAGDRVLFARGASFKNATITVFIPQSNRNKPVVFESFTPPWPSGNARPILEARPERGVFDFSDSGDPDHDEGYVVRGLELRGLAHAGTGIFIYNDVDHITLEDLRITGFAIGMQCSGGNKPGPGGGKDHNEFIVLRNSLVKDNSSQGILSLCHHLVVENNVFDDNGYERPRLDHNVYIEGGDHIVVRGNSLVNNGRHDRARPSCDSVSMVVHGTVHDLVIDNNFIGESNASDGCWGLTVDVINNNDSRDGFYDVVVSGNRIVNVGGIGIGMVGCQRCFIERNQIVWSGAPRLNRMDRVGIAVPDHDTVAHPSDGDIASDQIVIRNNSIYLASATQASAGIRSADHGQGHAVVSNLIYFDGASNASAQCFVVGKNSLASYAAFASNLCFRVGGPSRWSDRHRSLAAAASEGWANDSLASDPVLKTVPSASSQWAIELGESSPALGHEHPRLSIRPYIGSGKLQMDQR